jgi:hypothetical protein
MNILEYTEISNSYRSGHPRLRSTLDKSTLEKLDEKRELALKEDKSDQDRRRLDELDKDLGKLDFSHAARDPLYLEFIRAMTEVQEENPEVAAAAPTQESWVVRKNLAKKIAERLSKKEQDE